MLVVVRQEPRAVDEMEQTLLEAIADHVSISLLNARLFRALSNAMQKSNEGEKQQNALLKEFRGEDVQPAIQIIDTLLADERGGLMVAQRQALQTARSVLQRLGRMAEKTPPPSL